MQDNLAIAQVIDFPVKPEMKMCRSCETEKPLSAFYVRSKRGKQVSSVRCGQCENENNGRNLNRHRPYMSMNEIRKLNVDGSLAEKRCPTCSEWKNPDGFYNNQRGTFGIGNHCKTCVDKKHFENMKRDPDFMRNKNMINLYGITLDEARLMLIAQHGMCANRACGKEIFLDAKRHNKQKAFVDHDHATGKVRELLCISCNTALGLLEQKNKMLGLTEYIGRHQQQGVTKKCQ